jgi:predicted RNA-binding Zn-ribbon protein involved in translation (DUF1610 family)
MTTAQKEGLKVLRNQAEKNKCPDCGEGLDLDHAGCASVAHDYHNGGWKIS